MSSGGSPAAGPRLHRLAAWFDPEMAAVVTILMGLFQVLLSVLLASTEQTLPKFFVLPLTMGILIMAGGSLTMANERSPSRQLLQGCACSNVAGLVGAVLAFCLYCYSLSSGKKEPCVNMSSSRDYFFNSISPFDCPNDILMAYGWSVTLMLLIYDSGAIVLHSLLSISALKALKTE